MKIEVDTIDEAREIADPLIAEAKWAVVVGILQSGKFEVRWEEHKMYTAQDGKEYRDEVWITRDGDVKMIQDLEPEHAKNIIRMMIRNQRKVEELMNAMREMVETVDDEYTEETRVLH